MKNLFIIVGILFFYELAYSQQICDPEVTNICWTFSETLTECTSYPCSAGNYGYYADGSIWVAVPGDGDVVLTAVTPAWTGTDHGTMVNPGSPGQQGFKTNGEKFNGSDIVYSSSLNIETQLPYTLNPVDGDGLALSVVSSNTDSGNSYELIDFVDVAVITIVADPPSENAFRPPWAGSNKSFTITGDSGGEYTASDLDYSFLPQITPPPGAMSLSTAESETSRVWFDYSNSNSPFLARFSHPLNNINAAAGGKYGYQTVAAGNLGQAITVLLLDYTTAQKEQLYINVVQYGIDVYAGHAASVISHLTDGGHSVGRVMPLYVAAYALDNSTLMTAATGTAWYEQCVTFFIESTDWYPARTVCGNSNGGFGGSPPTCGSCTTYYSSRQYDSTNHPAGTPEWGQRHCQGCTGGLYMDDSRDAASYRYSAHHIIYPAMFVSFTHNENEFGDWSNDGRSGRSALYEYIVRHMDRYSTINSAQGGSYALASWIVTMYDDYWDLCTNGGCISGDSTPPTISSVTISESGENTTIVWSEAVVTTGYDNGDCQMTCSDAGAVDLNSVSGSNDTRTFTNSVAVHEGETCTLACTAALGLGDDEIEDVAGNDMTDISGQAVTESTYLSYPINNLTSGGKASCSLSNAKVTIGQ